MKSVFGIQLKLAGIAAGALALALAASCSNSTAGLQVSPGRAGKDTSGARVSTKISVTAKVTKTTTSTSVAFTCSGTKLTQGTLFFTDGSSAGKSLSGTSGTVSANNTNFWYCRAKLGSGDYWYFDKSGDYWYFDRSGTWKPASTTATARSTSSWGSGQSSDSSDVTVSTLILTSGNDLVSITFEDGTVNATSTSGLVSVNACYRNGGYDRVDLDGDEDASDFGAAECSFYVLATGDGGLWFFDSEGTHLPAGLFQEYSDRSDNRGHRQGRHR